MNRRKTKWFITSFSLLFLLAETVPATANDGHEILMDSLPYTSDTIILKWGENITFQFEIHTVMRDVTFEIIDLDGSPFGYEFEHEYADEHGDNHTKLRIASEGHGNETESEWHTTEGLPSGTHLDGHVVRHVTFEEAGNFSLLVSNAHDHPELSAGADTVSFKIKMTDGHIGVENMGASWYEPTDAVSSPGYEFFFVVFALVIFPVIIQKSRRR